MTEAKITRGMRDYLRRAAQPGGIPYHDVEPVGPMGRLPRPLFECIEQGLIAERKGHQRSAIGGTTAGTYIWGYDITEAGRRALDR